ncbi:hypothetical protein MHEL_26480 [Mycolicibacterium helvum]|uniref:Uncharacterized protein n=1 Tax=Mycolicibacterium helvum TaxID=1534349 RepID=A0A7I7T7Y5_9MYCO|nr:hypothetical protein MHEL_26480 [Mycolicibacterium helvum]
MGGVSAATTATGFAVTRADVARLTKNVVSEGFATEVAEETPASSSRRVTPSTVSAVTTSFGALGSWFAVAGFEIDITACPLVDVRALYRALDAADAAPADEDDAAPADDDPVSADATPCAAKRIPAPTPRTAASRPIRPTNAAAATART